MNPALRASAAHVFVQSLEAPELGAEDAHHLFRVLRLREGEHVTVSDGLGQWRSTAVVGQALQPIGELVAEPAPPLLTIATAIPKGDRVDWMVQKLTEVGVGSVIFLHCARSVVKWEGDRAAKQLARMQRVAREAAMQSRRVWLPRLSGPMSFESAAARPGAVIADPDGQPFERSSDGACTVLIGPEGGLAEHELHGGPPLVRWGNHVLRVETAAVVVAVAILI